MKAKAMVLREFFKPLEEEEFTVPQLTQGQILVKVLAAGVCGSDVHMYKGNDPRTPLPMILGHEGVGEVVEIKGKKVTVHGEELSAGQKILWNRGVSCGQCYMCQVQRYPALCTNRWVYGITRDCAEPPYLAGCYAQYIILDSRTDVFLLPETIDPAVMVPASCSGATTAHAFDLGNLAVGDTVLIQGPGPLGIFGVAFAKARGAKDIIVIGGTEDRLELCREFGATKVLNRNKLNKEERKEAILEYTYGRGVDVVYEAAGSPGAVKEGVDLLRIGGKYLSAGFGDPAGTVELDCFYDICRKNIHLQGVWVSDTRHTYQSMELIKGNVPLFTKLITKRYSLAQANQALEEMGDREVIKGVLVPN